MRGAEDKLWTSTFICIIASTLFAFMVGQGSNSGSSIYLGQLGEGTVLAGAGALLFSVAAAISRLVSGYATDAKGRVLVMSVGAVIMAIGCLGPLVANQGVAFMAWRLFQGFGFSALTTASATAAADILPKSRLGQGIGYYGLAQAISMSIGPAIAIFLAQSDDPENLYIGLSTFSIACFLFTLLIKYERNPTSLSATSEYRIRWEEGKIPGEEESPCEEDSRCSLPGDEDAESSTHGSAGSSTATDGRRRGGIVSQLIHGIFEPGALHGAIPIAFASVAFGFSIFYMGVYGAYLGVEAAGIYYTASAVSMIAVRLASGRIMDSAKPFALMSFSVSCGLVAYIMLICCSFMEPGAASPLFYAAGIPFGVCMGIAIPVNQTVAVKCSSPSRWGAANGLFMLGVDVAIGITAGAMGFILEAVGYAVALVLIMAALVASLVAAKLAYPNES